jgi:hypothetical protein
MDRQRLPQRIDVDSRRAVKLDVDDPIARGRKSGETEQQEKGSAHRDILCDRLDEA